MAAPLRTPTGVLGGLFVAWRSAITRFSPEQQRLLGVVAGAAGGEPRATCWPGRETDHSLRRRLAELQALARLAEQITRLTEEGPILEEVLAAIQVLAGLDGAVYAVATRRSTGAPAGPPGSTRRETAELIAALGEVRASATATARYDLDRDSPPAPRDPDARDRAPRAR